MKKNSVTSDTTTFVRGWRSLLRIPASPGDGVFRSLTLVAALLIIAVMATMLVYLFIDAREAILHFGPGFLVSSDWDPVRDEFGALPAIFGTLLTSIIAMLVAVPSGLGVAIYLVELAPTWVRKPASFLIELLAAVPSVILGLWALFVMVPVIRDPIQQWFGKWLGFIPLFKGPPLGVGFLAGGLILAVMTLPIIIAVTTESLSAVPANQREAMLALGSTKWESIARAVLPYARSGVVAAVMLGLGRAIGETMAVTMVIGNGYQISASLFAPGNTMASKVATEFAEASGELYIGSLIELALILFAITLIINVAGRLLVRRLAAAPGGRQ